MRNFNEGDIVVKFKPEYYGNFFHYEQFCQVAVVTNANDEFFNTNGLPFTSLGNSTNYTDAWQNTGYLVHNISGVKEKWYNWSTDPETINTIISKAKEDYLLEVKKNNDIEIAELRMELEKIEKKIERLTTLEVTPFGFGETNVKKHILEVEKTIDKKIKNAKN